jgi:hypothetical protein
MTESDVSSDVAELGEFLRRVVARDWEVTVGRA